ncbi:integrase, partial [Escherichia coli]|nr:integrase [Escherichia coli]
DKKLYAADLTELGISHTVLGTTGWLRKQNLAWPDHSALTKQGIKPANPIFFFFFSGMVDYYFGDCSGVCFSALHPAQFAYYYSLTILF